MNLSRNELQTVGIVKIVRALENASSLSAFVVSENKINCDAADDIATLLSHNVELKFVLLGNNNLQATGIIKIARALQDMHSLTAFDISSNGVSVEAADDIAALLSYNNKLQYLRLGGNDLQSAGAITIFKAVTHTPLLSVLDISNNNISSEAACDIASVLHHSVKLQELYLEDNVPVPMKIIKALTPIFHTTNRMMGVDTTTLALSNNNLRYVSLSGNNLQAAGVIKVVGVLCKTTTLKTLKLSNNLISEALDDIAAVLSCNTELQELDLSGNNLQLTGIRILRRSLHNISTLTKFNISSNRFGQEAAEEIAAILSHNTKLQDLSLGWNNIETTGMISIASVLKNTSTLKLLGLSHMQAMLNTVRVTLCNKALVILLMPSACSSIFPSNFRWYKLVL